MSEKQEKRKRYATREEYKRQWLDWWFSEPPGWRIFAHWRWSKSEPVKPHNITMDKGG